MISVFGAPRVGVIWEPSPQIFSEHIKDPELALCTNYTSTGSLAANESHIQFYLTDFLQYRNMFRNSPSGSPDRFWQIDPAGVLLPEVHLCKLLLI